MTKLEPGQIWQWKPGCRNHIESFRKVIIRSNDFDMVYYTSMCDEWARMFIDDFFAIYEQI
jgi:hypothetical protein